MIHWKLLQKEFQKAPEVVADDLRQRCFYTALKVCSNTNFREYQKAVHHQYKLPQNHAFHNENYPF